MRQMSDYDILYDESRRSDIIKIMKKRGFELVNFEGYGDDFVKSRIIRLSFTERFLVNRMNLIPILIRGITQLKFQNQADCV